MEIRSKRKVKSLDAKNRLLEWRMHKNGSKDMQERSKFELAKNSKNKCNFFFFYKDKMMNQTINKGNKDRIQPKV